MNKLKDPEFIKALPLAALGVARFIMYELFKPQPKGKEANVRIFRDE